MNLFTIIGINLILIPVTAGIDYLAFHKQYKIDHPGKPMKLWYFLPACFLELIFFNAGIVLGVSL